MFAYNVRFDAARDNLGAVEDIWEGQIRDFSVVFICVKVGLSVFAALLFYFPAFLRRKKKPSH